jgi:hypothetical protein
MSTNVRVESFGGLPAQPMVFQRARSGARVASRMRREAIAAPRRIHPRRGERDEHSRDADDGRPKRALEESRDASERGEDRQRRAAHYECRQRQLSGLQGIDHSFGIEARPPQHEALLTARQGLDLAEAVEVPEPGREVPNVRHDEVAGDELDAPADCGPQWPRLLPAPVPW